MLVKFTSSTSGQIMMFAPVARQLLELVGKDCSARGVITTEQLPAAIQRLRVATADPKGNSKGNSKDNSKDNSTTNTDAVDNDGDRDAAPIGLGQRAYPMIELLEWTRKADGFVLWEAAKDF